MDFNGYFLLFIVIACVVGLIYLARKIKELDGVGDVKPAASSGSGATTSSKISGISGKNEEEKTSGPPQNTIYKFSAKRAKFRCPFCDGENSVEAKVCNICGQNL